MGLSVPIFRYSYLEIIYGNNGVILGTNTEGPSIVKCKIGTRHCSRHIEHGKHKTCPGTFTVPEQNLLFLAGSRRTVGYSAGLPGRTALYF